MENNWHRGQLILTERTRNLTEKERVNADNIESTIIFSNFSLSDQGKSRVKVCELNTNHPDFENNRNIIEFAPDAFELLIKIQKKLSNYCTTKELIEELTEIEILLIQSKQR